MSFREMAALVQCAVPASPPISGLLLTPGAGSGRDQSALVAIDAAVTRLGILVERIDFPYRIAGRKRPDAAAVLVETVCAAARVLASHAPAGRDTSARKSKAANPGHTDSLLLGGRSMGGRICSMAVAEGLPAAGLVLVSYPLHPPGRPEKLRTDHFPALDVPCLFVSGRRDAFASRSELESATEAIPGAVGLHFVDGDHSLRRRDAEVAELVVDWIQALGS